MKEKDEMDPLLEYLPAFKVWYISLTTYISQFSIFIILMVLFWWISSSYLLAALVFQTIVSLIGTFPYRYISNNSDKIRKKYIERYGKNAPQSLWFHYESYTIPILSASMYFSVLLINYDFIPSIVTLQKHFLTNSLLPFYISIPIGIILLILGSKIRKPSGGFDSAVESYIYLLHPNRSKLIKDGIYQYIRHPRYIGRSILALGLGIIANNILAILIASIHAIMFCSLIFSEDRELSRRFGDEFDHYKKKVPALLPKFGNWKKFIKYILVIQR